MKNQATVLKIEPVRENGAGEFKRKIDEKHIGWGQK